MAQRGTTPRENLYDQGFCPVRAEGGHQPGQPARRREGRHGEARRRSGWRSDKQRVARAGQGKSGGYRTIILFRQGKRAFFVHGFAKSQANNISPDELKGFKKLAPIYLELPEEKIKALVEANELVELKP
jgi:hypothetical protein